MWLRVQSERPATPIPMGLHWRSRNSFIIATVTIGLFTDLFLYGLVVPVLPFLLVDRFPVPESEIQVYVSGLLAAYAGASVLFSVPAGWLADKAKSRRGPFLSGLIVLLAATAMLCFGPKLAILICGRMLQGLSAAIVWTSGLAMVLDTVGPENLGKVIGSIFSIISIGELFAPILGGVLYDVGEIVAIFGLSAGALVVDFVMRLLVIEKKTLTRYECSGTDQGSVQTELQPVSSLGQDLAGGQCPSLSGYKAYKIHAKPLGIWQAVPVLYCFRNPRLLTGMLLSFFQASLIAMYDATIPLEGNILFGFSSLKAGLLLIPINLPYLSLAHVAGTAVDKYGTKIAAVAGFAYLIPCLVLLRLPSERGLTETPNIILYCGILALNGIGLAIVSAPGIVEVSSVIQKYDKANPGFFGKNGPYAQLYGFSSMFFFGGLTIGPILGGALRDSIGYGNMHAVFAAISGLTAILSFWIIGEGPIMSLRKKG